MKPQKRLSKDFKRDLLRKPWLSGGVGAERYPPGRVNLEPGGEEREKRRSKR